MQRYQAGGLMAGLRSNRISCVAVLSLRHKLPMADSVILATAQSVGGIIWTQDAHFEQLPGVKFRAKSG